MDCTLRPVRSPDDLATAFDILGTQFSPAFTHADRRFADLARRYPQDRTLMMLAEHQLGEHRTIVGGALAFRADDDSPAATIRLVAVLEASRGRGVGRRLIERIEAEAVRLGVSKLFLGAEGDVRGFYRQLGYSGHSRLSKALPGSVTVRYGDADDRRAALDELRSRRSLRQARQSQ